MQFLSTFFPKHARPRTVVHAGPLLLRRSGGERSLRRYLRIPRRREVFLVHHGQESLREVAEQAGVTDIAVDASERQEANAATEMALALGARRLDFTIDQPTVSGPDGTAVREIRVREAEALARHPNVRPRIRAKLRAGCAALRKGMARVRIGNPGALTRDQATVVFPEAALPSSDRVLPRGEPAEHSGAERAPCAQPPDARAGGSRSRSIWRRPGPRLRAATSE